MLQFTEVLPPEQAQALTQTPQHSLTLPWDTRQRSRFLARLDGGGECSCILPRGGVLAHGDWLRSADGTLARVQAAPEQLSVAEAQDTAALLRAAYHLGNRHVPVQLELSRLAYQHDHVLDDMVRSLGLVVSLQEAPFAPESGAYRGGHGHSHGHGHGHEDDDHGHEFGPAQAGGLVQSRARHGHGHGHGHGQEHDDD